MATCTVSGVLKDVSDTAIQSATIAARVVTPYFSTTIQIAPKEITTTTASNGSWSLVLIQGASAIVTIKYPPNATDSARIYTYAITVPAASTANFSDLATES
jgi:hypothetical protein